MKKIIRIALTGTHSTGKSTVLEIIRQKFSGNLEGFAFTGSIARKVKSEGGKINKEADYISQQRIISAHVDNIIKHRLLITDRCIIDTMAYTLYSMRSGNKDMFDVWYKNKGVFDSNFIKNSYNYIFYFPRSVAYLENDGTRDADDLYRKEIDDIFFDIMQSLYIPFITIPSSLEQDPHGIASYIMNKVGSIENNGTDLK